MCEIYIDSLFVMWAIGGAFLGWAGMKSYRKFRSGSKENVTETKPDNTPETGKSQ